jgi:hypothetical protein
MRTLQRVKTVDTAAGFAALLSRMLLARKSRPLRRTHACGRYREINASRIDESAATEGDAQLAAGPRQTTRSRTLRVRPSVIVRGPHCGIKRAPMVMRVVIGTSFPLRPDPVVGRSVLVSRMQRPLPDDDNKSRSLLIHRQPNFVRGTTVTIVSLAASAPPRCCGVAAYPLTGGGTAAYRRGHSGGIGDSSADNGSSASFRRGCGPFHRRPAQPAARSPPTRRAAGPPRLR